VEKDELISVLEETISFLNNSYSSDWANMSVEEIIQGLESEITKIKNCQAIDISLLGFLFAPTGAIQETAIDNGWGEDFLRFSEIIDRFTDSK
jgi:hypothetical protein